MYSDEWSTYSPKYNLVGHHGQLPSKNRNDGKLNGKLIKRIPLIFGSQREDLLILPQENDLLDNPANIDNLSYIDDPAYIMI